MTDEDRIKAAEGLSIEQLRVLLFAKLDARRDQRAEDSKARLDEIEAEERGEEALAKERRSGNVEE